MKKRFIFILALMLMFSFGALAEGMPDATVPPLNEELFEQAKEALTRLSYGEYDQISPLLSYDGEVPASEDWALFAEKFEMLNNGTVQRDVSVGFWRDNAWYIAVPVLEPVSENIEVMVFISENGTAFSGFGISDWAGLQEAYAECEYILWCEEYVENAPIIISD